MTNHIHNRDNVIKYVSVMPSDGRVYNVIFK